MRLYGALFAVPIFAQSVLNYAAMQTGMLLFPGAVVTSLVMFQLATINPDTGTEALFYPF